MNDRRLAAEKAIEASPEFYDLLDRVIAAYEQRQRSIAVSIHEQIAQQMFGALLHVQALERFEGYDDAAARSLAVVHESLRCVIGEVRHLLSRLRLPVLDGLGVVGGLKYLICESQESPEQHIEFTYPDDELVDVPPQTELAAFRIVEQLLADACRYGGDTIRIELTESGAMLRIEMLGCGPRPAREECTRHGANLQIVRDWALIAGGHVAFDANPEPAGRFLIELPLKADRAACRRRARRVASAIDFPVGRRTG